MPSVVGIDLFSHNDFTVPGGGPYESVNGTPAMDTTTLRPGDPASLLIATTSTATEYVQYEYASPPAIGWRGFWIRVNTGEEPASKHIVAQAFDPAFAFGTRLRYDPTPNNLTFQCDTGTEQTSTITLDAWHWVEIILDFSGTTWGGYWRVDGVDKTTSTSAGHAASTVRYISLGFHGVATSSTRFSHHMWGSAVSVSDWNGEPVETQSFYVTRRRTVAR